MADVEKSAASATSKEPHASSSSDVTGDGDVGAVSTTGNLSRDLKNRHMQSKCATPLNARIVNRILTI